jgi:Ni,Fe-hydrogenase III component G
METGHKSILKYQKQSQKAEFECVYFYLYRSLLIEREFQDLYHFIVY